MGTVSDGLVEPARFARAAADYWPFVTMPRKSDSKLFRIEFGRTHRDGSIAKACAKLNSRELEIILTSSWGAIPAPMPKLSPGCRFHKELLMDARSIEAGGLAPDRLPAIAAPGVDRRAIDRRAGAEPSIRAIAANSKIDCDQEQAPIPRPLIARRIAAFRGVRQPLQRSGDTHDSE